VLWLLGLIGPVVPGSWLSQTILGAPDQFTFGRYRRTPACDLYHRSYCNIYGK